MQSPFNTSAEAHPAFITLLIIISSSFTPIRVEIPWHLFAETQKHFHVTRMTSARVRRSASARCNWRGASGVPGQVSKAICMRTFVPIAVEIFVPRVSSSGRFKCPDAQREASGKREGRSLTACTFESEGSGSLNSNDTSTPRGTVGFKDGQKIEDPPQGLAEREFNAPSFHREGNVEKGKQTRCTDSRGLI